MAGGGGGGGRGEVACQQISAMRALVGGTKEQLHVLRVPYFEQNPIHITLILPSNVLHRIFDVLENCCDNP